MNKNLSTFFSFNSGYKLVVALMVVVLAVTALPVKPVHAAVCKSTADGAWATPTTWTGGGCSGIGGVPADSDTVTIANVVTVTTVTQTAAGSVTVSSGATLTTPTNGNVTFGALTIDGGGTVNMVRLLTVLGATNITGTINFSTNSKANVFIGDVTLNSGAVWNETINNTPTFSGSLINNATTFFTSSTGTYTFNGAEKTFSGTTTIPRVAITGTYTNTGTLIIGTSLAGAGTLINDTGAILDIANGTPTITTLTATAAGNTVKYSSSANQTAIVTTYDNLTLGGTSAKTFATSPTVNGILSMEGSTTSISIAPVYGANATLKYNKTGSFDTGLEWPATFSGAGGVVIAGGTIALGGSKILGTGVPLTISSGAILSTTTNAYALTVGGITTIDGTLTLSNTADKTFTGAINVNSGGTLNISGASTGVTFNDAVTINGAWNEGSGALVTFANNLTNNATSFTTSTGIHIFSGTGKTISGAAITSIPYVNVTGTYTNNGTLTVGTSLTGTGTLINGATGTLNIGDASTITGLTATAAGNTVNYNKAGAQTVNSNNYYHLILSGSGAKSLQAGTTTIGGNLTMSGAATTTTVVGLGINGNLNIGNGATFTAAGFDLTVGGTTTVGAGTSGNLTISYATGTKIFTGLVTINASATWNNSGNSAVTFRGGITSTPTFTGGNGVHTFDTNSQALTGTFSIPSIIVTGVTLTNHNSLTVATALNGTGELTNATTGSLHIDFTGAIGITTLTTTAVGNTVDYGFAGAQTVRAVDYHNLTLSGTGAKTFPDSAISLSGSLSNTAGTMTPGTGTIAFTGASASITGNGAKVFYNLQINSSANIAHGAGAGNITINNNFTNDGTFTQDAGLTTTFAGASVSHSLSGGGTTTFGVFDINGTNIVNAGSHNFTVAGASFNITGTINGGTATVIFDSSTGTTLAGSGTINFNSVTINSAKSLLNNTNNKNFNVSGNWTNNGGTFTPGTGTVTFNGSLAQTISGSSATIFNNLTVSNSSGVNLGANATVNGMLALGNNTLTTNSYTVALASATGITRGSGFVIGNLQKLVTGTGTLAFEVGTGTSYAPISVTFNAVTGSGTLTGSTTADRHPNFITANISDTYIKRYWTLTPSGLTSQNYDATFTFANPGDFVGSPTPGSLVLQKYSSSSWTNPVTTSSTSTTVTGTGFTSFSDFFSGNGGTPTPVTLSYFKSERSGNTVNFTWSTATETGNIGFNLYVETDGLKTQINDQLIPSNAVDSLERQDYSFSAEVTGDIFHVEEVSVFGDANQHGPFQLGQEYGGLLDVTPIDWAAIQAEHDIQPASAPLTLDQVQAIPDENTQADTTEPAQTPEILPTLTPLPPYKGRDNKPIFSVPPIVNLRVRQSGLYRVTYEMLRDAGHDLSGMRTSKLQLTNRGQLVPIYLKGNIFGPGTYFEFYAQALDTIYTDTNIYSLQIATPSSRIPIVSASPRKGLTPPAAYTDTLTVHHQRAYASFYALEDGWYDTSMLVYTTPKSWSFPFEVANLAADTAAPASLELTVWGVTDWPQAPDHHLLVSINGVPVANQTFDGLTVQTIQVNLPRGTLVSGTNILQLTLPGDTGVQYEMVNLDKFSLTYQRTFQAQNGRLTFTATGKVFTVTNLPSKNVSIYRLDTNGITRLNKVQVKASGSTFNATFAGTSKSATYLVSAVEALYVPVFQSPPPITNLNRPAQYLIIAHPDFLNGLQPLIQARQAQGLTVSVVNVNDLYTRYTYGIFDPQAIQQYIAYAYHNLGTQYVLLVGGDTYDYRNYLGKNSISFIPSLYATTGAHSRLVPVDPLFADVNGDNVPDLALGRFPVRTTAELNLMVSKTLAYANKNYGRTAVFASDKFDGIVNFKNINLGFAASLPAGWTTQNISLDDLTVAAAQTQLIAAMNSGTALITFTGHSGPTSWTFSGLFNTTKAAALTNAGRPFVVVQWGCWNTYHIDPVNNYLVQSFLFSGDKGAAAVLGASTLTDSESEDLLGQLLTPRLVTPGLSIGQALLQAKTELAQSHPDLLDVLLGWSIMGDPALVIEP